MNSAHFESPFTGHPLVEQYFLRILPRIPVDVARQPSSAAFRSALHTIAIDTGVLPTRSETRRTMQRLHDLGLLEAVGHG